MTRIIGGTAGGRRLVTPRGTTTRPTSDRVREALFSAVESWCGSLHGLRFLDLYAGSGAVGLEAWSRGAAAVTFVEHDRRTASTIVANAETLGLTRPDVRVGSVSTMLGRPPAHPYDVVFLDPPYPTDDAAVDADLSALDEHGWLAPGALLVVERSSRSPEPGWPDGVGETRSKRYGETLLWYGHAASGTIASEEP